jgi:hypothetical protein
MLSQKLMQSCTYGKRRKRRLVWLGHFLMDPECAHCCCLIWCLHCHAWMQRVMHSFRHFLTHAARRDKSARSRLPHFLKKCRDESRIQWRWRIAMYESYKQVVSLDFVHCYPIFVRRSQNDVSPARARVLSSGYVMESQWLIALRMNETCKSSWFNYSTLGHYTLSHQDSVMVREIAGMRTAYSTSIWLHPGMCCSPYQYF